MYSKHVPRNWKDLLDNENNELWNVISKYAGALIVDKTKTGIIL